MATFRRYDGRRVTSWRAEVFCGKARASATFRTEEAARAWAARREAELAAIAPPRARWTPRRQTPPAGYQPLSVEQIAARALPLPKLGGVYFLLLAGVVVYVGRSSNVHGRVREHIGAFPFDAYAVEPCSSTDSGMIECYYIARLRPRHNAVGAGVVRADAYDGVVHAISRQA